MPSPTGDLQPDPLPLTASAHSPEGDSALNARTPARHPGNDATSSRTRRRAHMRPPLVVSLCALAAAVWLAAARALIGPDTWLALTAGRLIAHEGLPAPSDADPWLVGADHPWVDQQWLGQLIFFGAERIGGLGLVVVLSVACLVAALGLAASWARRAGAHDAWVLVVGILAIVALSPFAQARTQTLMLPAWVALLMLIDAGRRHPARLAWLIPLLVVWTNVHGSVLLACLVALAGSAWAAAPHWRARTRRGRWLLAGLGAGILAAPWVSPYALTLPGYYARMLDPDGVAAVSAEWASLDPRVFPALTLVVILALVVAITGRRHVNGFLRVLLVALSLATMLSARHGVWLIAVVLMCLPVCATAWRPFRLHAQGWGARILAAVLSVVALVLAITVMVRPDAQLSPSPAGLAALDTSTSCPVLAEVSLANWLLWRDPALAGRLGVDTRMEVLSAPRVHAYQRALAGQEEPRGARFGLLVLGPGGRSAPARRAFAGRAQLLGVGPSVVVMSGRAYAECGLGENRARRGANPVA